MGARSLLLKIPVARAAFRLDLTRNAIPPIRLALTDPARYSQWRDTQHLEFVSRVPALTVPISAYGRGGGVGRGLAVGTGRGVGVAVGVTVAVGVGLGPPCTQYLPPVFKSPPVLSPPQTIISLPVQTAL